jgi:RHS repeat-associated protein
LDSHTYNYNPANQRTKDTLADGSYWIYQYDSLGQVTGGNKYWSDGTPVAGQQFDYTFDNIGNRIQTQAGGDQNGGYLRTANYTNNTLNQITSRDVPGYVDIKGVSFATNTVTVNGQTAYRKVEYFRKELGVDNSSLALWTNIIVAATGQTSVTGNVLLAKSPQAFVYDADGNLTSDGLWTNTWDAENRLIATQNLTNVPSAGRMKEEWSYLPDGRWNQRIVSSWNGSSYVPQYTNRFVWDGKVLLAILDQTNGLVMSFMRGLDLSGSMQGAGGVGGLLAVSFKTNGTHFAAFDGNGNVSALVNAADGTTSANYEYDPFGQTIRITGAVGKLNPIRFSTQFADDVTQRIKYLHREYTPSTGTWSNHDPINEIGFQTLNRSRRSFDRNQEKNLYCFIANDPIKNIDLYALACGFFVVSPKQVPIYGSDADKRGVTPGTPVDGFSVRFVPDKNCCTCAKNNIHLVQTISFKHNYVPWWSDPTFDEQTGSGNLEITDAPWSGWLFGTAFKLKDCAYCSDGKALGCVSFTWAYDSFNSNPTLNPSGPSQAQDP